MNVSGKTLHILLMDDDIEVLQQLRETLPTKIQGYSIQWEECDNFDKAFILISTRRYDIIVTDLYRDTKGMQKGVEAGSAQGLDNIKEIRQKRFCPVVAFSDGSMPVGFVEGPFTKFADKSNGNADILSKLNLLLKTGIPEIASRLHDELDGIGAVYLWGFLEKNWDHLQVNGLEDITVTERLIRRRAAIQLGRLSHGSGSEQKEVEGVEFYICPKISDGEYRLGEIIKSKRTGEFRVVLTPHCYLHVQPGDVKPRADMVLTAKTVPAADTINQKKWAKSLDEKLTQLRRRIKANPEIGKPEGRYWFLPRFLEMPDLYCDFMHLESLSYTDIVSNFEPFAVLDTPFAEALQASFAKFYSAVGVGDLRSDRYVHLMPQ